MEQKLMDESLEKPYIWRIDYIGVLNYAFAQSSIPLISEFEILNNTIENLNNVNISISFEFDYIQDYSLNIEEIPAGKSIEVNPILSISSRKLFELTEFVMDEMRIKVTFGDEVFIDEVKKLPIFPMNQWSGVNCFPESLASFVTPNIPQVIELQYRVGQILEKNTGNPSIDGYLSNSKNRVREIMAAIFATITELQITYALPPSSFTTMGQLIRTPKDVLEQRMGTCIEMAVLYSALCEACGLNPFIVLVEGHAFAGAWLEDNFFDSNKTIDVSELTKRVQDGINDIEVLECTYMNKGTEKDFEQAVRNAKDKLDEKFYMAIDIRRSHYFGIRPMPIKVIENNEVHLIDYGINEDASDTAKLKKTIEEYYLDTSVKGEVDKRQIWLRNLLDLSKRNTLISFKPGNKNIQIFNSDLSKLEDSLSKGYTFDIRELVEDWTGSVNRLKLVDVESQTEVIEKISEAEFKAKRLRTFLTKDELEDTLKNIYRDTKKTIEESGASSLFLAMGFLKWFDPKESTGDNQIIRYAPIVLVPIDIIRKSNTQYQLTIRDEDSQMNVTLLEMLRQKFDLNINGLNPLPEDESGIDLTLVLNSMRKAIMNFKGWDILEVSFISNFSFSQFVMWNDLNTRFDKLTENAVVKGLVEGRFSYSETDEVELEKVDESYDLKDVLIPTSVDSSQLLSVIESVRGKSFVLHGPPGTGKSQTITNIIANALYNKKSVLFVAEKMAALNVVNERLSRLGLGEFCMEIHSNKIQKRVVLEKLGNNLNMNKKTSDDEYLRKAQQIQDEKAKLSVQLKDIYNKRKVGYSIFDLMQLYNQYTGVNNDITFEKEILRNLDINIWEYLEQNITNLEKISRDFNFKINEHPLNDFRKSGYRINLDKDIISKFENIDRNLESFDESSMYKIKNIEACNSIVNTINDRNLKVKIDRNIWDKLLDIDVKNILERIVNNLKDLKSLEETIYKKYSKNVDNIDISKIKEAFLQANGKFFFKSKAINSSLIPLNSICSNGFVVNNENANSTFDEITLWQTKLAESDMNLNKINSVLNGVLDSSLDKFDTLEDLLVLINLKEKLELDLNLTSDEIFEVINLIQTENVSNMITEYNNIYTDYVDIVESCGVENYITKCSDSWVGILKEKIKLWNTNLIYWKDWSVFYECIENIEKLGFKNFIKVLLDSDSIVDIKSSFMKNLTSGMIELYIEESENLNKFSGNSIEFKIDQYNKLIEDYEKVCSDGIINSIVEDIPNPKTCSNEMATQIANINRAIQSKGRGISIREIFSENSEIIKKLTPCMLMSPLSVSQYIDLSFPKFDLVIFDEASQIQTGYAIGAMSRAENCIIVGDPNQMPPTSFFTSTKLDEENLQIEDLESLLEDCLAINMPQNYLKCHYRSNSESLIAFSNKMYYSNKMNTFPSPNDIVSSVKFILVDGIYDRGNTRTNRIEAESIVNEIKTRILSGRTESLGVVTFNISQQFLIDDLLQEEFSKDSKLEELANALHEPIFIKNLENVQGDERDVILFSISFGKDKDGKFYQNFGPIAKKGGWRRLNVAVSRARKEMLVFSSIKYDEINLSSASSEGVRGVKKFLEYAQKGISVFENKLTKNENDDYVVKNIVEELNNKGYKCAYNIGSSGFKVPIGVIDPNDENKYILGILIDDKSFNTLNTVRDKVRLIPKTLKMKGWNIYRIWNVDYYGNKNLELEKLFNHLKELNKKKETVEISK